MKQKHLFSKVRKNVVKYLNGYNSSIVNQESLDDYICPPSLGENSGVLGGLALAKIGFCQTSRRD